MHMDNGHDLNRWWFRLLNPSCLNRRLHLILSRRAALHPVTLSSTRSAPCWTRSSTRVTRPLYPRAASTRPRFVSSLNHWDWKIIMTIKCLGSLSVMRSSIIAPTERCWQVLLELRGILDHPTSPRVRHLDCAQGRAGTQQGSGTPYSRVQIVRFLVYNL